MYIDNSNIILSDITLKKNYAYYGGAIYCDDSYLQLNTVLIDSNTAIDGGGIYSDYSNLYFNKVTVSNNIAENAAGGISVFGETLLDMYDCSIVANKGGYFAGGIYASLWTNLNIRKCIFSENQANDMGGALYMADESLAKIENSNFLNNKCTGEYGGGGAINIEMMSNLVMKNSLIIKNDATFGGAGILCTDADLQLINVTISGNRSNYAGGALYFQSVSNPVIINSIIYNNSPSKIAFVDVFDSEISVAYSLIQGGQSGIDKGDYGTVNWLDGNINVNPLFVNLRSNDFALQYNSPCIGAGIDSIQISDSTYYAPEFDYYSNIRPNPAGSSPDLGAIENKYGEPTSIYVESGELPLEFSLHQNYPNPFNPKTVIQYVIGAIHESPVQVDLSIYNSLGQKVCTLVSKKQSAGQYSVEWDASEFASSIYFYRLQSGPHIQVRKMLFIK